MTTAATEMLVVTLPVRAAAMVVVAPASSSTFDPLELPELPDDELTEPLEPLEVPAPLDEPPELPDDELVPLSPDELLLHAKRRDEESDATAREARTSEEDFMGART